MEEVDGIRPFKHYRTKRELISMHRLLPVLCISLIVLFIIAYMMGEFSRAATPITAHSTVTLEGKTIKFESEYWPEECGMKDGKITSPGLHEIYYSVLLRINTVTTMDEIRSLWSRHSWEKASKMGPGFEPVLQNNIANQKSGKPTRLSNERVLMSVLAECDGHKDLFIVIAGPMQKGIEPQPGFAIQTMTFEDGAWKYDVFGSEHPVRKELGLGAWKQFGAPADKNKIVGYIL